MATLNIGGKRVKVDDAFLKLSPEQQQATVEEIAAQMGGVQPQSGVTQLKGTFGDEKRSLDVLPTKPKPGILDASLAAIENTIEGIPFLGPLTQRVSDFVGTQAGGLLTGQDPKQLEADLQARRQGRDEQFPATALSGNLAGSIASLGALGAVPAGATALGLQGPFWSRVGNSALSGAGISMLDEKARGGDGMDVLTAGGIGGALGGLIPGIGAGLKFAAKPVIEPLARTMRGAFNPTKEAATAVGNAIQRDRANVVPTLTAADEAAARMNGQPVLNVDRGGEVTRALMRSAANQNPEARAIVEKTAEDRFRSQSSRVGQLFTRLMGGNVDDLARKAEIGAQARPANKAAYGKAYNDPAARAVWSPQIRQLMQSDSFRAAISAAEKRGTDVAAAQGFKAVRNPFVFGADGSVTLRKMPDGSTALPSLQFWDQVKRELDSRIGMATRAGDKTTTADLMALKSALVGSLDQAVPSYKQARGIAASFFDAEDAVDAGRKAWSSPKAIDESLAAIKAMSASEREDFGVGLVSQIMDDVRGVNNRSNMTRLFDVDAKKQLLEAALGPAKARQVEGFLRVEDILDKVRGALGNSTTARQLVEMGLVQDLRQTGGAGGIGGIAGFAASGGNIGTAATMAFLAAAGRAGYRAVKSKADEAVLQKVAEMLASGDEAVISRAVSNALLSKRHMEALEAIQRGLAVTARGSALALAG